ncbi:geraniol 8-hydroxylase-like [Prosopis cineraria]|uniref:geraniol 8-hydroxylase-like n=1 Tax=Prosopis cineraria TaxID=364024 RepID=UPI00240ED068|nr:geraniol 8-hydroxylase-like [Prosopis cineraria]
MTNIVISSPDMAIEALHKHDLSFSGRTVPYILQTFDHHILSVVYLDPSVHLTTKIFSSSRLDSTQNLRLKKLQEMLEHVNECCRKGEALDISEVTFTTSLNSITSTLFSVDLAGFASDSSREFRDTVLGILEEAGKPNIADFFPVM